MVMSHLFDLLSVMSSDYIMLIWLQVLSPKIRHSCDTFKLQSDSCTSSTASKPRGRSLGPSTVTWMIVVYISRQLLNLSKITKLIVVKLPNARGIDLGTVFSILSKF